MRIKTIFFILLINLLILSCMPFYNPFQNETYQKVDILENKGPEIHIRQDDVPLNSGAGLFDFGNINLGSTSGTILFTIENQGLQDLMLTGSSLIQVFGMNPDFYIFNTQPQTPIGAMNQTTFNLTFIPVFTGEYRLKLQIDNNDADENLYTFQVIGTGVSSKGPGIDVWASAGSFSVPRYGHSSVVYNGYLYIIGGKGNPDYLSDIKYAPIAPGTGAIGAWNDTTPLLTGRYRHASIVYNGYLYVIGGKDAASKFDQVIYYKINTNGTLGNANVANNLPSSRSSFSLTVYNDYLYVIGGSGSTNYLSEVLYAKINIDGTLETWHTASSLITGRVSHVSFTSNAYIYVMGGWGSAGALNTTEYASINADGSLGVWQSSSIMLKQRSSGTYVLHNNRIYLLGGDFTPTNYTDVDYTEINSNGSLGVWQDLTNDFTTGRTGHTSVYYNDYLYIIGGWDEVSSYYNDIQITSFK